MKNIAVIGAGISGLAAAYLLSRRHRVHLFEQEARLGGHTNTVLVDDAGRHRAARHRLPGAQRPHLSEPGAAVRRTRRGHPRLGHVVRGVVPADRARVQQPRRQRVLRAAAEPGQAVAPVPAPRDRALQSGSAGAARCAGRGAPDARRLSRVAPLRRGVHPSLSVSHGVGHLVGLARRDPIVSGAHADPLLRQPRAALAQRAADVEGRRRRQPHLHSQAHRRRCRAASTRARRFRRCGEARTRRHDRPSAIGRR